jgi:adenosylhomocysteine nucleosidase
MIANRGKRIIAALILLLTICANAPARQVPAGQPTAILGIPEETEELASLLKDKKDVEVERLNFVTGELNGRRVVLARIGFGKVNAALAATLVIEHFKPEGVIFTGAAGALNPDLVPGDIVIGTQTTQHDFGMLTDESAAAPAGFTHWRTRNPITNERNPLYFTAGDRLIKAARAAAVGITLEKVDPALRDPRVIEGVIVTGDQFVSERSKNYELGARFDGDAVEMEGAAVAQISWQFGVPCLVIRSISDTASGSSLVDYYKFVKIAARNSSNLVARMVAQLSRPEPAPHSQSWKLAFELAFGEDSPYAAEFPDLYKLPYETNFAITKDVLDRIVAVALKETGAKQSSLRYLPGGYKNFPVVPSAQFEVEATDEAAEDAMNIIGYLAQQTAVIASNRVEPGNRRAIQIIDGAGTGFSDRKTVQAFWGLLGESSPKLLPGFSSAEAGGKPGLYIIDADGDWLDKDQPKFVRAVERLSKEFGIATSFEYFTVEYVEQGNNWKLDSKGEQYLRRFDRKGMSDLRRRLETEYQPQVRGWIRKAFEAHALDALRRHEPQDKRVKPLARPRLYTLAAPAQKHSAQEYAQTP